MNIKDLIENFAIANGVKFIPDYVGRAMASVNCIAISSTPSACMNVIKEIIKSEAFDLQQLDSSYIPSFDDKVDELLTFSTENCGFTTVYYWPNLFLTN